MVLSELAARLNCAEYKNWVKAGHCLLLLRSSLQGFVNREVLSFHRELLAAVPGLGPHATCRGGSRCSPRARQVSCCPWSWAHIHTLSPIPCACCLFLRGAELLTTPGVFLFSCPAHSGPSSPLPPVVSASVSGVHGVETRDPEASPQQKWRRALGKLQTWPLARGPLGGSQGKHLQPGGKQVKFLLVSQGGGWVLSASSD